ncbi:hypothetical protein C8J57DRAFT_1358697 [Mycena rebaudengoi]|nr:hypothetical protein C8J57DRAFT_1358697 [Mycena rebaudengoi]
MGRGGANWVADPLDVERLVDFLHEQRSRVGQGGNFDDTVMNEAAVHMESFGAPMKGDVKTAASCSSKWIALRKLHDYILAAIQKTYPGISGWTYTHQDGFNVTDETMPAWRNFANAHRHFKPFANEGWPHFDKVHEILPTRAKGKYVFNAARAPASVVTSQTQADPDEGDIDSTQTQPAGSDTSQPVSNWSQSQSQPYDLDDDDDDLPNRLSSFSRTPARSVSASHSGTSQTPSKSKSSIVLGTPVPSLKRTASDDDELPWGNKRSKLSGPESILMLARSVNSVGGAVRECFAPKASPSKKLAAARKLAMQDMRDGFIPSETRTRLSLKFAHDPAAADAYLAEETGLDRADMAQILLE